MDHKRGSLGVQVVLGIFGFFWAGGLSLAAGNGMVTSLVRGAIGLFGLFFLGWLLRYAFRMLVDSPAQQDEVKGTHIDLLLDDQKPEEQHSLHHERKLDHDGQDGGFVPLAHTLTNKQSISDEEARMMADALRTLDDD